LLQLCLSLEPSFAAYHAAWEFVLAHHGGRLDLVAQAWNANLSNKEVVRELTRAEEGLGTRGYLRDDARWAREFARRYFSTTAAAVRAADPNHLVLGCRFRRGAGASVLAECVYPAVDVSMVRWTEVPSAGSLPSQPVLADDVSWVAEDFLRTVAGTRTRRLTTFERMLRKARSTLDRVARHPAVVGYSWAQWQDEPGEQPPFAAGLVHANGTEAREHTELLTQFNLRAESLHRAAQ
jgi:agarase